MRIKMNIDQFIQNCNTTPILKEYRKQYGEISLKTLKDYGLIKPEYDTRDLITASEILNPEAFAFKKDYFKDQLPANLPPSFEKENPFNYRLAIVSLKPDFQKDIFNLRKQLGIPPLHCLVQDGRAWSTPTIKRLIRILPEACLNYGKLFLDDKEKSIQKYIDSMGYFLSSEYVALEICKSEFDEFKKHSADRPTFLNSTLLKAIIRYEDNVHKKTSDPGKINETFRLSVGSLISHEIYKLIKKYRLSERFYRALFLYLCFGRTVTFPNAKIRILKHNLLEKKLASVVLEIDSSTAPDELQCFWKDYLKSYVELTGFNPLHKSKRKINQTDFATISDYVKVRKRSDTDSDAYKNFGQLKRLSPEAAKKKIKRL